MLTNNQKLIKSFISTNSSKEDKSVSSLWKTFNLTNNVSVSYMYFKTIRKMLLDGSLEAKHEKKKNKKETKKFKVSNAVRRSKKVLYGEHVGFTCDNPIIDPPKTLLLKKFGS